MKAKTVTNYKLFPIFLNSMNSKAQQAVRCKFSVSGFEAKWSKQSFVSVQNAQSTSYGKKQHLQAGFIFQMNSLQFYLHTLMFWSAAKLGI